VATIKRRPDLPQDAFSERFQPDHHGESPRKEGSDTPFQYGGATGDERDEGRTREWLAEMGRGISLNKILPVNLHCYTHPTLHDYATPRDRFAVFVPL